VIFPPRIISPLFIPGSSPSPLFVCSFHNRETLAIDEFLLSGDGLNLVAFFSLRCPRPSLSFITFILSAPDFIPMLMPGLDLKELVREFTPRLFLRFSVAAP